MMDEMSGELEFAEVMWKDWWIRQYGGPVPMNMVVTGMFGQIRGFLVLKVQVYNGPLGLHPLLLDDE